MNKRPFTPESLAMHWDVSAASIRNMCQSGELRHFRVGRLYRIPAAAVEELEECQKSALEDSEAGSAPIGGMGLQEGVISLRQAPERRQRRKQ